MHVRRLLVAVCLGLVGLALPGALGGDGYDLYAYSLPPEDEQPVPDVNKNPLPPPPVDASCWQAAAANMLAAAGWRQAGQTPAIAAQQIYEHMTGHFGKLHPGWPEIAMTWWMYNYGYNPNRVDGWYMPDKTYSDVLCNYGFWQALPKAEYEFLLDELGREHFAAVTWVFAAPGDPKHCMTLVGGNFPGSGNPLGPKSVWHDSDFNGVAPGDDVYTNAFAPETEMWTLTGYEPAIAGACGVAVLGQSVERDDVWNDAAADYEAAYYRDPTVGVGDPPTWRPREAWELADPTWQRNDDNEWTILDLPVGALPPEEQDLYLLIDFEERCYKPDDPNALPAPEILLKDADGDTWLTDDIFTTEDGGQLLYIWESENGPAFDKLIFPDEDFHDLSWGVWSIEICSLGLLVPEPGTLALLVLVGIPVVWRRR